MKSIRRFETEAAAECFMRLRNRTERNNQRPQFVVLVDGPEDDFVVMDLREAIQNGFLYRWSV